MPACCLYAIKGKLLWKHFLHKREFRLVFIYRFKAIIKSITVLSVSIWCFYVTVCFMLGYFSATCDVFPPAVCGNYCSCSFDIMNHFHRKSKRRFKIKNFKPTVSTCRVLSSHNYKRRLIVQNLLECRCSHWKETFCTTFRSNLVVKITKYKVLLQKSVILLKITITV